MKFLDEVGLKALLAANKNQATSFDEAIKKAQSTADTGVANAATAQSAANAAQSAANKAQAGVDKLNGSKTQEGSVAKAIDDRITALVNGAPAQFDTLKEIADYLTSDTTGAEAILSKITSDETIIKKQKVTVTDSTDAAAGKVVFTLATDDGKGNLSTKDYTINAISVADIDAMFNA